MSPDTVFTVCTNGVLPAWILLAVAPRWAWTQRLVHALWIPLLLAPVYAWALVTASAAPDGAGFGSLQGVILFFTVPKVALAGWLHYLAFDLFIGAWEVRDAGRHDVPHLAVLPCLVLTLLLGPVGLGLYLLLRAGLRREWLLEEGATA